MRSPRPSSPPAFRGIPGALTLVAVLALAGCGGGDGESGPPRLTPNPQYDMAEAMIGSGPVSQDRLNACGLLDLTTAEVIALTDSSMPVVEPTGSGDLGLICTYGGPGSPERAEAADETTAESTWPDSGSGSTTAATTSTTSSKAFDSSLVPDTFAAGVTTPNAGAEAALAGQATLLGDRYACSEIRGAKASTVEGAPESAEGAPPPTQPALDTAYIDCVASPTGGGVEVHTILISGDHLWHITLLQPEVARSAETEKSAIAGLHRVAKHILD